jgi:hypothetical protein
MGKRELLLIVGFVVFGAIVYQITAPPPREGEQGFSLSRMMDTIRREVRGNRASAEVVQTQTYGVAPGSEEIRLRLGTESLTITGEDRGDIGSELRVWSNGFDSAEAERYARETTLKVSDSGSIVSIEIHYPEEARQRANLVLRVPARMRLQVARYSGRLNITNAAAAELLDTRGTTNVRQIAGGVIAAHRGGDLTIADAGAVKLNTRGSDVTVSRIRGNVSIQTQAGEVRGSELGGTVDIETSATDLTMDKLEKTPGPIRVNASAGEVRLRGLAAETRIDARNTLIDLVIDQPAAITVYNEDEDVTITAPRAGYRLDATVKGGQLTAPEPLEVTDSDDEQRAAGSIGGGGPTLTLRVTRADLRVRAPEPAKAQR